MVELSINLDGLHKVASWQDYEDHFNGNNHFDGDDDGKDGWS